MLKNVGLIGYGKWGKILHQKLETICNVKFICTRKDNYLEKLDNVDWVIVATPDNTHYEIVSNCIQKGKNVFCEKPLTPTETQSALLFKMASEHNVKLYVDDVQNYRDYNFKIVENNLVTRTKTCGGYIKDILYRLAYHDIYTLYEFIKNSEVDRINIMDVESILHFNIKFKDKCIEFLYDLNSSKDEHHINGYSLSGDDDILTEMLNNVLCENVDFAHNKKISLFTNKFIDKLNSVLFKRIAVIGGGVFGCTAAARLAEYGYKVDLFEQNNDIFTSASSINQYRLHRGYHYPRSKETAHSSRIGESSFLTTYGNSIVNGSIKHYYCIAKSDSLVSANQYIKFMDDNSLEYEKTDLGIIKNESVSLTIIADEYLFDPRRLKSLCNERLNKCNVNVNLNMKANISYLKEYDHIINATYANINGLVPKDKQKDYQFELCEKPVIKLPKKYKNKSVVIMDGPFMCIDPLSGTDYHVMGNVVHAIHSTNVGKFPNCDLKFNNLLNKGIIKNPPITNIDKFIESAKRFFVDIDAAIHIGSMFTFRTVLPNKDKDDARPTLIEKIDDRIFSIFSGKIGTCVDVSDQIIKELI